MVATLQKDGKRIAENSQTDKNCHKLFARTQHLEVLKLDISTGHEMNIRTGLALAVSSAKLVIRYNAYRWELGEH